MARVRLLMTLLLLFSLPAQVDARMPGYEQGVAQLQALIKANDFPAAEKHVQDMLRKFPDNPELQSILARLFFWQQKYDRALTLYDRLVRRKPTPTLKEERAKVLLAREFEIIDRLKQLGNRAEAIQRLEKLYASGGAAYESGYRLASLYLQAEKPAQAVPLLEKLVQDFPADLGLKIMHISALLRQGVAEGTGTAQGMLRRALAENPDNLELLAMQAGVHYREGRDAEAVQAYDQALRLGPDPSIAAERTRAVVARDLEIAGTMADNGDAAGAEALLESTYDSGKGPFEAGYRLALLRMRLGLYAKALPILAALKKERPADQELDARHMEAFLLDGGVGGAMARLEEQLAQKPNDPQLLQLAGRLHLWDQDYQGAIRLFQQGLMLDHDEKVREQLEEAVVLERYKGNEELQLQIMAERSTPELLRLQARYNFWQGRFDRSRALYLKVVARQPAADLREEMERVERAAASLNEARPAMAAAEDALRTKGRNYLKLSGELTSYTKGMPAGRDLVLELSQRFRSLTIAPFVNSCSRFRRNDTQAGAEITTSPLSGKIWGAIGFSSSPGAVFLPRWTTSGTVFAAVSKMEASLGYRHMQFAESAVDLFLPGMTIYLPAGVSLDTRIYIARTERTVALSAAAGASYEPSDRWRTYYAVTAGRSAESVSDSGQETVRQLNSIAQRGGGEYRITPTIGIGGEISHTYRQALYNTTGVSVFTRIRW